MVSAQSINYQIENFTKNQNYKDFMSNHTCVSLGWKSQIGKLTNFTCIHVVHNFIIFLTNLFKLKHT